ncbi:DUF3301 domain-containing protein [Lysobacter pythonis]|uniref:DUF3301 domain-containing protein n=1 Tax=Solilutibacter pythonis TaxID=2483112 RepID=A0A3M2HM72_9GAMM|nr:DUF3301 domain-containing protein [Lysobacter pythonis]RMH88670.1 DUF3301 domain-containing protein [Lysobacter pythonis]
MENLLWAILAVGILMLWVDASHRAADRAREIGRRACRRAGVQWLDESVHATGMRIRRAPDGRLGLERRYRFEYSRDGSDRHAGTMSMLRGELTRFVGPVREEGQVSSLDIPGED